MKKPDKIEHIHSNFQTLPTMITDPPCLKLVFAPSVLSANNILVKLIGKEQEFVFALIIRRKMMYNFQVLLFVEIENGMKFVKFTTG